jgi:hypothetical protein
MRGGLSHAANDLSAVGGDGGRAYRRRHCPGTFRAWALGMEDYSVLAAPHSGETLRNFCRTQTVNEVYLSYSPDKADATEEEAVAGVVALLHRSGIRVEALLSSVNADEPGAHREKLLGHVRAVLEFNRKHPRSRFDGIHLDVEPQQRPENKGPGNLVFLPGLLEAYREVRALAEQNRITVNADIPTNSSRATWPNARHSCLPCRG